MTTLRLVPLRRDGLPRDFDGPFPPVAEDVFVATASLYEKLGFVEPWLGYVAVEDGAEEGELERAVGSAGFKGPPVDGRVEIAYFTFPDFEGGGRATEMAKALVDLARRADPEVIVAAQTLPDRNASHRILEKLGFEHTDTLEHPEDGTVWEWRLPPGNARPAATASLTLNDELVTEILRRRWKQSPLHRWLSRIRWTFGPLVALAALYELWRGQWATALALGVVVLAVLGGRRFDLWRAHRMQRKSPHYQDRFVLTFGEEGVHTRSDKTDGLVRWSVYPRVDHFPDGFLLYQGDRLFQWIPHASLGAPEEVERLERLLREKVPRHEEGRL